MSDNPLQKNLTRLGKFLKELKNNSLTKAEFIKAFEKIVASVAKIREDNARAHETVRQSLKEESAARFETVKQETLTLIQQLLHDHKKETETSVQDIVDKVDAILMGKRADELRVISEVLAQIVFPEQPEQKESAEETRDKLQTLKGEDRLDKSAIKGLDKLEKDLRKEIAAVPRGTATRASNATKFYDLSPQTNGSKKIFSVPKSVASILHSSDFPNVLMEKNGFTINATRTQITLTTDNAPSPSSQLLYQYSSYFN